MGLVSSQDGLFAVFRARECSKRYCDHTSALFLICPNAPDQLISVHARHADIAQEQVRLVGLQHPERVVARSDSSNPCAPFFQNTLDELTRIGFIVYE